MISVGFSLTDFALASDQAESVIALERFDHSVQRLREAFADIRALGHEIASANAALDPAATLTLLEKFLAAERMAAEQQDGTTRILSRKGFQRSLHQAGGPEREAAIRAFLGDLETTRTLLRELRLRLICQIAQQARSAGLDGIDTSDSFRTHFLRAPIEETESWQETAHLMADPENAKRLEAAIRDPGAAATASIETPPRAMPAQP
jgi:hypothetical protein